jgi:hypothetical protein
MPTPRPIITPSVGDRGGRGHHAEDAQAGDRADDGRHDRQPGGDDAAEAKQQHDDCGDDADQLRAQVAGLRLGGLAEQAAVAHRDPGGPGDSRRVVDLIDIVQPETDRVDVEVDRRVGGLAVLRRRRL